MGQDVALCRHGLKTELSPYILHFVLSLYDYNELGWELQSYKIFCKSNSQFSILGILKNTQIHCSVMKEMCACVQFRHKGEGQDQETFSKEGDA